MPVFMNYVSFNEDSTEDVHSGPVPVPERRGPKVPGRGGSRGLRWTVLPILPPAMVKRSEKGVTASLHRVNLVAGLQKVVKRLEAACSESTRTTVSLDKEKSGHNFAILVFANPCGPDNVARWIKTWIGEDFWNDEVESTSVFSMPPSASSALAPTIEITGAEAAGPQTTAVGTGATANLPGGNPASAGNPIAFKLVALYSIWPLPTMKPPVDTVDPDVFFGQGTFGVVARATRDGVGVAAKRFNYANPTFKSAGDAREAALVEVVAHTACGHHRNLSDLVDVDVDVSGVILYYTLADRDLQTWLQQRAGEGLSRDEIQYVIKALVRGAEHIHAVSLVHTDITPKNIWITGDGLGDVAGKDGEAAVVPKDEDWDCLAQRMVRLPTLLRVCISDLGSAVSANPAHRVAPDVDKDGLHVGTLFYQAPEVMLGDKFYSSAVDMWALGCVGAELVTGKPLFSVSIRNDVTMIKAIFTLLGTPSPTSNLARLPHYKDTFPKFRRSNFLFSKLPTKLQAQDPSLLALLGLQTPMGHGASGASGVHGVSGGHGVCGVHGFLQTDPVCRLAARAALEFPYLRDGTGCMEVFIANAPAHRGRVSVVRGRVPDFIRRWLQGDVKAWSAMHDALIKPADHSQKRRS